MARIPYTKPALTYSQQLEQLKIRGLVVENEAKALHVLENISYFRLSGYWFPMLKMPKEANIFKEGSSFDTVFYLYCFDKELRKLVITELEKIEVAIRTKMIYDLSHKYGPYWYINPDLFRSRDVLASTLKSFKREHSRTDEEFIKSFNHKYTDPLPPSWMILEISSFGSLSSLYQNLKPGSDKRKIAAHFGLDDGTLISWLHHLAYVRNICAHHSRLWNRKMSIRPRIPINPAFQWLSGKSHPSPSKPINERVYFLLSMIVYLLNVINPGHKFQLKLQTLLNNYCCVSFAAMGFPENWLSELIWRTS